MELAIIVLAIVSFECMALNITIRPTLLAGDNGDEHYLNIVALSGQGLVAASRRVMPWATLATCRRILMVAGDVVGIASC